MKSVGRLWQGTGVLVVLAFCLGVVWAEEQSPVPNASVARAIFTTAVVDREPVDDLTSLPVDRDEVYFFTDLRGLEGRTVTHRWEYGGQVVSEVPFEVGGPRWRVYSKKSLKAAQAGEWTVMVLDESGWPLEAGMFLYGNGSADSHESSSGFDVETSLITP